MSEPRVRAGRVLVREARNRAQVARMNEVDRVVRNVIEAADLGGEFHDMSTGHEIRGEYEHTPRPVGFTLPGQVPA